jgi:hypothetical protein
MRRSHCSKYAAPGGGPTKLSFNLDCCARGASPHAPGAFSFTQARCAARSFGGLVRIAEGANLRCRRGHGGAHGRRRQDILSRQPPSLGQFYMRSTACGDKTTGKDFFTSRTWIETSYCGACS